MKMLTKNGFKKQQGFTLIELVIVIVILGILAATAAPKFIDLTSDAKASVMRGVEASIESAVSLTHAKALVAGATTGSNTVEIDNKFYAVVNGYPAAKSLGDGSGDDAAKAIGLEGLLEISGEDFVIVQNAAVAADPANNIDASAENISIQHKSNAAAAGETATTTCRIVYVNSTAANTRPGIDNSSLEEC